MSALASVLEYNLSEEVVLAFKQESLALGMRLVVILQGALPAIAVRDLTDFLHPVLALIAGLWPLSHPSETVNRNMSRPEFALFQPDFEVQFQKTVCMILAGVVQNAESD